MTSPIRYAHNGDVHIAYEVFGDPQAGKPLLLIMGLDFQMVWWPDLFCEQLVEAGFAVVRFDNRDTGLSTHFTSPKRQSPWRALMGGTTPAYTGRDMVDDAIAVMDAVGWQSAHVLGGSMGAGIAQAVALFHPGRVRTLTSCMGLPVGSSALKTLRYIKFGIFPKLARISSDPDREAQVDNLVTICRAIASPGFPFDEAWARSAAEISHDRAPRDPKTTQRQLAAGRATHYPALSTITVPALVISGADDPLIKPSGGRDTARAIPGARFISYPGMGHDLPAALWPQIIGEITALAAKAHGQQS
jgi:pimeloyl-ACP methyl ester carboxylesterase